MITPHVRHAIRMQVVLLSYPILAYPVPYCLNSLLRTLGMDRCGMRCPTVHAKIHHSRGIWATEPMHCALVTVFLLATTSVALLVSDLGLVVSLIGALSATVNLFVMGPVCYLRLVPAYSCCDKGKHVLAVMMVGTGCVLAPCLVALQLGAFA